MNYHEQKANEFFDQVKAIEDKDRLIGFRLKNDERGSTDGVSIRFNNITTQER